MYKQIIIARKDLHMSPGKLAAQVSHASMAFLTAQIQRNKREILDCVCLPTYEQRSDNPMVYRNSEINKIADEARTEGKDCFYIEYLESGGMYLDIHACEKKTRIESTLTFSNELYNEWIQGTFTKCVLQAKNKKQLLKAVEFAKELGMKEGKDFFLIKDNCYTELEPEEVDENGIGRTLTCIGFAPMAAEIIDEIGKKYHLYDGG